MGLGVLRLVGLALAAIGVIMLVAPEFARRLLLAAGVRWEPDPSRRVASWGLVILGLAFVALSRVVR